MRVLILHSVKGKLPGLAKSLQQVLVNSNIQADLVGSDQQTSSTPITTGQYQVICVLSPFTGIFKPQIPADIDKLIKKCTRLDGKKGVACVPARLGSSRGLKVLMARLEQQGVIVEDFQALRSPADIKKLADRIGNLG